MTRLSTRVLLAAVVQARWATLPAAGVDDPPVQGHRSVRGPEGGDVEGRVVLAQVDHDLAAVVVVGVEVVEDPARLDPDRADGALPSRGSSPTWA